MSNKLLPWLAVLFCLNSTVACAAEVRGTVRLEGPAPSPVMMTIQPKQGDHSTEGCGSLTKASQELIVNPQGGVENAVVWLEVSSETAPIRGIRGNSPINPLFALDQKGCVFEPHILAVPAGSTVSILNSDSIRHNVRIFQGPKMLMHKWQPADAADLRWRFTDPGRYVVRCGIHPWMYAWVVVLPHSFHAVTDPSGDFRIPAVPPGKYQVHVWHEKLGSLSSPMEMDSRDVELKSILFSQKK